jgi:DNA-binding NarL/FixJ family response regulator
MKKIRVLLVDDHAVVREGLTALLNAQPDMEVVGTAPDGESAWRHAVELRPDVVVMDLSMPGNGGAEATRRIKHDCPDVHVLALTVHEVAGYARQFLECGGSGYVLKRAGVEDLARAIRQVARDEVYIDPQVVGQVVAGLVRPHPDGKSADTDLTQREIEVIKMLARGHINREIAEKLDLSVKTIEMYRARVLEKLGLQSRADLVHYAMRQGWLGSQ